MKVEFPTALKLRPIETPDTSGMPELAKRTAVGGTGSGFADAFRTALSEATQTASEADAAAEGLVRGEVEIHEAMVATQKADLVLRLGTTVRNKLLDAYRQLSQTGG